MTDSLSLPVPGRPITLDAEASSVHVRLDDPFRAFRTDAYNVSGSNYVGYAILSGGSQVRARGNSGDGVD